MPSRNLFFRSLWCLGSVIAAVMTVPGHVSAAVTNITGNPNDYFVSSAGTVNNAAATTVSVGGSGTGGVSQSGILIFTLPTLAAGQSVGPLTSLTINVSQKPATTTLNGDLWGVGNFPTTLPAAGTTVAPNNFNFYSNRDDGTDNANATGSDTKIVDNFLTPAQTVGTPVATPTGAGNNLQSYIQLFYTANPTYDAMAGQAYVYLRINPDSAAASTANRYLVSSADTATAAALRPVLSLDIISGGGGGVPEPSVYCLMIGGGAVLLGVRRLRRAQVR